MAHFPPVRPVMPGAAHDPVPGARRTWLALLLGAGAVALLAGLVWGIITATRAHPGDPSPAARATPAASPALPGQQTRYRVTRVQVAARQGGMRVRWSPPSRTVNVIWPSSGRRLSSAWWLPAWRATFVRASCATR